MTPLQKKVEELIAAFEAKRGVKLSGRELSDMLGKSRNHLSQIMNDGLIPSGEVLLKLTEVLEAPKGAANELMMAVLQTKAQVRSRDTFWITQALELTEELAAKLGEMRRFLAENGQLEKFQAWLEARKPVSKKNEGREASESQS